MYIKNKGSLFIYYVKLSNSFYNQEMLLLLNTTKYKKNYCLKTTF